MAPTKISFFCIVLLVTTLAECQEVPSYLESILHFLMVDGSDNNRREPKDKNVIYKEYDFVVVGAGTAGCVVANRLTEVPDWNVLLIEAGMEENFIMDIPIVANFLQFSQANWKYKTEPSNSACLGMENNQCHWPRGKVVGGSSVLNYMIFTRGNKMDYDQWEALGNKGWGWRDILPYFKKMEDLEIPQFAKNKKFRGTHGYLPISYPPYRTPIADAFVQAGKVMGYPIIDFNGPRQIGFNYLQTTMQNGTRMSSSRAYLHPVSGRSNLHMKKRSMVTKILIDPTTKTAVGVEFQRGNRRYIVRAKKEVIVSAGTINSAQLLMLSGVGPKDHLASKNIKVIQDAKVGYNLQDHTATGGLTYIIDKPYSLISERIVSNFENLRDYFSFHEGPLSIPGGCEALGFIGENNVTESKGYPDIELLLVSGGIASEATLHKNFNVKDKLYQDYFKPIEGKDTFMIFPLTLRPKSVGRIMLRDNNPMHYPLIYPKYFTDSEKHDIKIAISGIRKANAMVKTEPFRRLGARFYDKPLPPCQHLVYDSDAYWECFTRHFTFTIYHHVGTCKMGPSTDPNAVVDERLRVRGINNLRVIDASVMPFVPAAHTNAPTYLIAEKGADMIKEDWGIRI